MHLASEPALGKQREGVVGAAGFAPGFLLFGLFLAFIHGWRASESGHEPSK
jgi:hypothetical protein